MIEPCAVLKPVFMIEKALLHVDNHRGRKRRQILAMEVVLLYGDRAVCPMPRPLYAAPKLAHWGVLTGE